MNEKYIENQFKILMTVIMIICSGCIENNNNNFIKKELKYVYQIEINNKLSESIVALERMFLTIVPKAQHKDIIDKFRISEDISVVGEKIMLQKSSVKKIQPL